MSCRKLLFSILTTIFEDLLLDWILCLTVLLLLMMMMNKYRVLRTYIPSEEWNGALLFSETFDDLLQNHLL